FIRIFLSNNNIHHVRNQVSELNCTLVENECVEGNEIVTRDVTESHVGLPNEDEDEKYVPVFENYDNVFKFYKNSKKDEYGIIENATFTCSREGQRVKLTASFKPQFTIKNGCEARLTACSDITGTWKISGVHLEHNHAISPSKSRLYRCHQQLSAIIKRRLEVNDVVGIPLHKSFNSGVVEVGGYEKMSFIEEDCRNYIAKVQRLRLGEEDAAAIQSYFSKMQANWLG
ncbi:FAR1-related protein, partial [Striga asiatica]